MARRKSPPTRKKFTNRPLARLGKFKLNPQRRSDPPAPQKEPESASSNPEGEERLFAEAMDGVSLLAGHSDVLPPEPRLTTSRTAEESEREEVMQALQDLVDGEEPLSIHETDEAIEGSVEGLDPRILAKLRKGEFSVQDYLDLHGLTREQAKDRVKSFIDSAMLQRKRCVLIIHGRGLRSKNRIPVLKNALDAWFTRRALSKKILAFTTAKEYDGGGGAVYVLLKKHKPSRGERPLGTS